MRSTRTTGIPASLISCRTSSQPVSMTGEKAMTSTSWAMKSRSALIWFSCFCWASTNLQVEPLGRREAGLDRLGVRRAPTTLGPQLGEADADGVAGRGGPGGLVRTAGAEPPDGGGETGGDERAARGGRERGHGLLLERGRLLCRADLDCERSQPRGSSGSQSRPSHDRRLATRWHRCWPAPSTAPARAPSRGQVSRWPAVMRSRQRAPSAAIGVTVVSGGKKCSGPRRRRSPPRTPPAGR